VGRKFESYLGSKIRDNEDYLFFFAAMFYIYILLSERSGYYYIGHSDDPVRRLSEHNNMDKDTYTSKHRPWKIVFQCLVSETRSDAIIIEKYLKNRKSKGLLKKLATKQKDSVFLDEFIRKILKKRVLKM
jgi:putative endonuclease